MPIVALSVAVAALVVAAVALLVGWRAVRVLDRIAARLAADEVPGPGLGPDWDRTRVRSQSGPSPVPSGNDEEAEPPAAGGLRLHVERPGDRGPVLVLRNDGVAPVDDAVLAIDGWFTGARGGPYENDPPPSHLMPGASWRCPIADPPGPGHRLHVLLRWSRDGTQERREVELPC